MTKFLIAIISFLFFFNGDLHCENRRNREQSDFKDSKTLVLIICSDNLPVYKGLQKSWKSYMHLDPNHFECYFIRGNPHLTSDFQIDGDTIWSKTQESLTPGLLNKTLLSLEAMLPHLDEFNYILRTNLSSFYVFPQLLEYLNNAPKTNFYAGIHHGHGTPNHESGWICGAGIIMSTDLVKILLNHKNELFNLSPDNHFNVDDVAIGDLFNKYNIHAHHGLYREIYSQKEWAQAQKNLSSNIFHFRVITPPPNRTELDLSIHKVLLQTFYQKDVSFDDCL